MIDRESLLKKRGEEATVDIPGVGEVRVRALTRGEALSFKGVAEDVRKLEQHILALAMVDPEMSEDDVRIWQECSPAGEAQIVFDVVLKLSGMEQHADKAAYKSVRE